MTEANGSDIDEEKPRRFDVELFVVHPTMTPAAITAALGIEAQFVHSVSEPRMTPKGTLLGGRYPDTRWRHSIRYEVSGQHFADKVTMLVDRLLPHKAFFAGLRSTGGSAEVIVEFLGDGYLADNVPAATLANMAELQLDFGIACYVVRQNRQIDCPRRE
jgi:hypothetical protein